MKRFLFLCFCTFWAPASFAQQFEPDQIEPDSLTFENIFVKKIASDAHSSTFVIWVKQGVKNHYHARHTEQLVVLEGTGMMTLGDQVMRIKKGDFIRIPMGTHHAVEVTSEVPLKVLSIQAPEFHGKDRVWIKENP